MKKKKKGKSESQSRNRILQWQPQVQKQFISSVLEKERHESNENINNYFYIPTAKTV